MSKIISLPVPSSLGKLALGGRDSDAFTVSETRFWSEKVRVWKPEVKSDSFVFCFNTSGYGSLRMGESSLDLTDNVGGWFYGQPTEGHRAGNEVHRFVTIEVTASLWISLLGMHGAALRPEFSQLLLGIQPAVSLAGVFPKEVAVDKLARQFLRPPVAEAARLFWLHCKIGELFCQMAFASEEEKFCARYQRVSRERVEQVVAVLRDHLSEPPNLAELGKMVGSSPFHLSRIFSAETGRTIPQYLRQLRMERAAELLQSGKYNVTETAFAIGYSSLSHFSKSYFQTFGVLPKNGARLAG